LRAPTFKVLVGKDGTCFNIPATLAKGISEPLYKTMNGEMKEARDGVAILKEVESDIFTAFCEYAYTRSYRIPKVAAEFEKPYDSGDSQREVVINNSEAADVPDISLAAEPAVYEFGQERARYISPWSRKVQRDTLMRGKKAKASSEEETTTRELTSSELEADATSERDPCHWDAFCKLEYDSRSEESEGQSPQLGGMTKVEFKPLLFHCRLYVFAQMYLIASLKQLTLRKLHADLTDFDLDLTSSNQVLEALKFAFTNTERGDGHDDKLRHLLVAYTASNMKVLKQNTAFWTLLDEHGELGSDIIQVIG
jgi:hypothetical protein